MAGSAGQGRDGIAWIVTLISHIPIISLEDDYFSVHLLREKE